MTKLICESYCSHGGVCELDPGHEGLHDSSYCQWADAQSLTREAADEILREKPDGEMAIALWDMGLMIDSVGDDIDQL
jgi:hypothetical protein